MSEPSPDPATLADPLAVIVHLAFAFDIGDEINLDLAREMLQGELGQIPRRKRTPESIGYRPAPIRVPLEPTGIHLPGDCQVVRTPRAELTLFDFGAVSLAVQFSLSASPTALLQLAGRLAEPAALNEAARATANSLDRPASTRGPRFLAELDERGVHRLPAWRSPDRLARKARGLDRWPRQAGNRTSQRGRGARGHQARPLIYAHRPGRARLGSRVRGRYRNVPTRSRSSNSPTSSYSNSATSTIGSMTALKPPTG